MSTMSTEAPAAPAPDAPAPPAQQAPPAPAAPESQQPPAQPAPPAQQQPAAPQPPAPVPAPPPSPPASAEGTTELERVTAERDRWKAQARAQEQRSKANHTELKSRDAVLRQIAEKVGIEFDDKPDPEELTRKLDQANATARQRSIELAVYTTAAQAGGNALAILDSREFMARTEQLDPDAADFPSLVADLVREAAVQARYQAAPPPAQVQPPAPLTQPAGQQAPAQPQPPAPAPPAPASGSDFSGAPGGNRLWTEADYEYWTAPGRDRDGTVITEAIQKGLLVNLGVGKPRTRSRR